MASFTAFVASGFLSESCCPMSIPGIESCVCAGEDCEFGDCCAGEDAAHAHVATASRIIAIFLLIIEPPILPVIWLLIARLLLMITLQTAENFTRVALWPKRTTAFSGHSEQKKEGPGAEPSRGGFLMTDIARQPGCVPIGTPGYRPEQSNPK